MLPMKQITRTQTGVRLESRLLKVLKALATELDLSLGDLIEGIVLHAFEGKAPFSAATLRKVRALREVYGLDLTAQDAHQLREAADHGR
jgi:predicted DNA-binding ribbon-helix-helix protein